MGILRGLVTAPVSGPLFGLTWLATRIAEAADQEMANPERIEKSLLDLGARLEAGEIDEATHDAREAELLAELAALRAPADDADADAGADAGEAARG